MTRTPMVGSALDAVFTEAAAAQDKKSGSSVFKQCMICRAAGPDAQNKIGPELIGLDGRCSGSVPNCTHSDADKNSGIVGNGATFKQYIANSQAMSPDKKIPIFAGLKEPQRINDLWAYLKQLNADGSIRH